MFKKLKKQQEGFTIIEVMIVLVIAAVILLIVFLAVPALQRNSRNTQRKNDVAGILGGINEYINNNGGKMVDSGTFSAAIANAKLGFYNATTGVTLKSGSTASYTNPVSSPGSPTDQEVFIYADSTCTGSGGSVKSQNRTIAAVYQVESGSGGQYVCQTE